MKLITTRVLDQYDVNTCIILRLSGATQTALAKSMNVSNEAVLTAQRKNKERMEMFVEIDENVYGLAKKDIPLHINGELICHELDITGDEKDGVIYCDSVYVNKEFNDYDEDEDAVQVQDVSEWSFDPTDVGIIKKIRVGKVKAKNPSSTAIGYGVYGVEKIKNHVVLFGDDEIFKYQDVGCENKVIKTPSVPVVEDSKKEYIWNASNKFISISLGRDSWNADPSHPNFKEALKRLAEDDIEGALDLIQVEQALKRFAKGSIVIENGELFYKGMLIKTGLTKRIVQDMQDKKDFEFYLPFLENLMLNPSNKAVNRLFDFLEANDIEITSSGYFIAWKKVRSDYHDIYSGTMDNSVGKLVEMPRNQVNEDDNQTCSDGLHVCSKSYLSFFGNASDNRVVKVKVHPRDVVSIPVDYNNAKMRTCRYEVLEDVTEQFKS